MLNGELLNVSMTRLKGQVKVAQLYEESIRVKEYVSQD